MRSAWRWAARPAPRPAPLHALRRPAQAPCMATTPTTCPSSLATRAPPWTARRWRTRRGTAHVSWPNERYRRPGAAPPPAAPILGAGCPSCRRRAGRGPGPAAAARGQSNTTRRRRALSSKNGMAELLLVKKSPPASPPLQPCGPWAGPTCRCGSSWPWSPSRTASRCASRRPRPLPTPPVGGVFFLRSFRGTALVTDGCVVPTQALRPWQTIGAPGQALAWHALPSALALASGTPAPPALSPPPPLPPPFPQEHTRRLCTGSQTCTPAPPRAAPPRPIMAPHPPAATRRQATPRPLPLPAAPPLGTHPRATPRHRPRELRLAA